MVPIRVLQSDRESSKSEVDAMVLCATGFFLFSKVCPPFSVGGGFVTVKKPVLMCPFEVCLAAFFVLVGTMSNRNMSDSNALVYCWMGKSVVGSIFSASGKDGRGFGI